MRDLYISFGSQNLQPQDVENTFISCVQCSAMDGVFNIITSSDVSNNIEMKSKDFCSISTGTVAAVSSSSECPSSSSTSLTASPNRESYTSIEINVDDSVSNSGHLEYDSIEDNQPTMEGNTRSNERPIVDHSYQCNFKSKSDMLTQIRTKYDNVSTPPSSLTNDSIGNVPNNEDPDLQAASVRTSDTSLQSEAVELPVKPAATLKHKGTPVLHTCRECQATFKKRSQLVIHERRHTGERPYKCDLCPNAYAKIDRLKVHKRRHTGERPFKCDVCDAAFVVRSHLNCHKKRHDTKQMDDTNETYRCHVCQVTLQRKSQLEYHRMIHNRKTPYQCETCQAKFIHPSNYRQHVRIHGGERPHKCALCEAAFFTKAKLRTHMRRHTGEKPFVCDICQFPFSSSSGLSSHKRTHTGERPYVCKICQAAFARKCNLISHMATHAEDKEYQCQHCSARFSQDRNLKRHLISHLASGKERIEQECHFLHTRRRPSNNASDKPFDCTYCNKRFKSYCALEVHERIHTGEKPFKCDVCQSAFAQKIALRVHTRSHTGEKPFKCDQCNSAFTQSGHLKNHMRTHTGEKPFKCNICNAMFADYGNYLRHTRIHTGEKPHVCEICRAGFHRIGFLEKHMHTHNRDLLHQCEKCDASFALRASLKSHMRIHSLEGVAAGNPVESRALQHSNHDDLYASLPLEGLASPDLSSLCDAVDSFCGSQEVASSDMLQCNNISKTLLLDTASANHFSTECVQRSVVSNSRVTEQSSLPNGHNMSFPNPNVNQTPKTMHTPGSNDNMFDTNVYTELREYQLTKISEHEVGTKDPLPCLNQKDAIRHLEPHEGISYEGHNDEECIADRNPCNEKSMPQKDVAIENEHSGQGYHDIVINTNQHSVQLSMEKTKGQIHSEFELSSDVDNLKGSAYSSLFTADTDSKGVHGNGRELLHEEIHTASHEPSLLVTRGMSSEKVGLLSQTPRNHDFSRIKGNGEEESSSTIAPSTQLQLVADVSIVTHALSDHVYTSKLPSTESVTSYDSRMNVEKVPLDLEVDYGRLFKQETSRRDAAKNRVTKSTKKDSSGTRAKRKQRKRRQHMQTSKNAEAEQKIENSSLSRIQNSQAQTDEGEGDKGHEGKGKYATTQENEGKNDEDQNEKAYMCNVCNITLKRQSQLEYHQRIHARGRPFKCETCQSDFADRSNFRQHMRTHTGERPYKCALCQAAFSANGKLKTHMRRHTGEKPFVCSICQFPFTSSSGLSAHKRTHTGERPFVCEVCQAAFARKCNLDSHVRIHKNEKPFKCKLCPAEYSQQSSFNTHMKKHAQNRTVRVYSQRTSTCVRRRLKTDDCEQELSCDVCKKTFGSLCSLETHQRIHTGEKPFKCNICQSAFAQKIALRVHTRSHTGEKPFKCDQCNSAFTQSGHLKNHMRTHTGEKPFKCNICNAMFADYGNYLRHTRIHTGEKPHVCEVCDAGFHRIGFLEKHMNSHNVRKMYQCEICCVSFALSASLKSHMRIHNMTELLNSNVVMDSTVGENS